MKVRSSTYFAITPLVTALIGLITVPVLAWGLGVEDIGKYSFFQTVMSLLIIIYSCGLDQAFVREYNASLKRGVLFFAALMPGFALLVTSLFIVFLIDIDISTILFDVESSFLSCVVVFLIYLNFFVRFFSLWIRMRGDGFIYAIAELVPKVVFLCLLSVLFYASAHLRNLSILFAVILSTSFLTLVLLMLKSGLTATYRDLRLYFLYTKRLLGYGLPLVASTAAFWGLTGVDRLFLNMFSSFVDLGIYSTAATFASSVLLLQAVFSNFWGPYVYSLSDAAISSGRLSLIAKCACVVCGLVWVIAGLFSPLLSFLLPIDFSRVPTIFQIAVAYPVLYSASEVVGVGPNLKRKTGSIMFLSLLVLVINITANYFLIPLYGAEGAAIGTGFSFFVYFSLRAWLSVYHLDDVYPISEVLWFFVILIVSMCICLFELNWYISSAIYLFIFVLFSFSYRYEIFVVLKSLRKYIGDRKLLLSS